MLLKLRIEENGKTVTKIPSYIYKERLMAARSSEP